MQPHDCWEQPALKCMLWHTCHISGHYNIYNISKYNSAIRELEVERLRKRHSDLQTICPQDHAGQGADLQKSPANKAVAWVMRQHVGSQMSGTVGPHVREGHGKTAYPTFTFILQYIYIKKTIQTPSKDYPPPALPCQPWCCGCLLVALPQAVSAQSAGNVWSRHRNTPISWARWPECHRMPGAHHFCAVARGWDYIESSLLATQFSIYCQALQALQRRRSFTCKQAAQYHRTSESWTFWKGLSPATRRSYQILHDDGTSTSKLVCTVYLSESATWPTLLLESAMASPSPSSSLSSL